MPTTPGKTCLSAKVEVMPGEKLMIYQWLTKHGYISLTAFFRSVIETAIAEIEKDREEG